MKRAVVQQFLVAGMSRREFVEQFKNAHPSASISLASLDRWIIRFGANPCGEILQKVTEVVNVVEIPATEEVLRQMKADKPLTSGTVRIVVQGEVRISFNSDFPAYDAARVAAFLIGGDVHEKPV
jgi:hypothetical protein